MNTSKTVAGSSLNAWATDCQNAGAWAASGIDFWQAAVEVLHVT